MGREWYFNWGSKSSSKKGGGTKKDGGQGGSDKSSVKPPMATAAAAVAASGGCMNAVLHMFDFNHFHLCLHPNDSSYLQDDPIPVKGVEAPRNSLESITEDENDNSLKIPVELELKTNRRDTRLKLVQAPRAKVEDTLSQSSCSPASVRTPTLVARLMGLDLLPESSNTTPRSSSSYSHISPHSPHITSSTPHPSKPTKTRTKSSYDYEVSGPRSSLETSSSSQRRRSTDEVDPHRLSLQINKVKSIVKEIESSRPSCSAINTKRREGGRYEDENKSPGYYARQIMKQVKETVSRRVGADITNTIGVRDLRRDEHLLSSTTSIKSKRLRKESPLSTSPKLVKISETGNKISEKLSKLPDIQEIVVLTTDKRSENEKKVKNGHHCSKKKDMGLKKLDDIKPISKTSPKSYDSIRNKKDDQFVRTPTRANSSSTIDKKCKSTPLSSDFKLVHASVPSIMSLKKHSSSPQPPPKLLEKQAKAAQVPMLVNNITTTMNSTTQLSRSPSHRTYKEVHEEVTLKRADPQHKDSTSTSTSTSIAEFQYISRVLKCTGIDRDTPISFTRWFSPSHPLDPSIFHTIETSHYLTTTKSDHLSSEINLGLSINRKLIFHLVDEMLADILKPYDKVKPFHKYHNQKQQINGFQLVKTLCTKLRSFPSKDCQTLQDIDTLVEKDIPVFGAENNSVMFEHEGEAIVTEIEGDIVDSLVQEMAMFLLR